MGKIQVLPDVLQNQIAAGEVVERPASAAKELIENALDAGATQILVELLEGGLKRLRVVDNGCGMTPEDARIALQRHATSKLSKVEDLLNIATLGFRGEALPSIASVSHFRLKSRVQEALGAVQIAVDGGQLQSEEAVSGPVGTEVVVEDLFYNVPARRKFVKKPATEAAHIGETIERLALCYPQVAFRFVKEGRTALDLPPHAGLMERAYALFGEKETQNLKPLFVPGPLGLDGLCAPPFESQATPRRVYAFVNGRFVRDKVIQAAIQAAFRPYIERNRYPFLILRLRVPPALIDVNVHPAKIEVRFADSSAIHRLIWRSLDDLLRGDPWHPKPPAEQMGLSEQMPAETPSKTLQPDEPQQKTAFAPPVSPPPASHSAPLPPAAQGSGLSAHRRRLFDVLDQLKAAGPLPPQPAPKASPAPIPIQAPASDMTPKTPPLHPLQTEDLFEKTRRYQDPVPVLQTPPPPAPACQTPPAPLPQMPPAPAPACQTPAPEFLPRLGLNPDRIPFAGLKVLGSMGPLIWAQAEDGLCAIHREKAYVYALLQEFSQKTEAACSFSLSGLTSKERLNLIELSEIIKLFGFELESMGAQNWTVTSRPEAMPEAALLPAFKKMAQLSKAERQKKERLQQILAEEAARVMASQLPSNQGDSALLAQLGELSLEHCRGFATVWTESEVLRRLGGTK